MKMRFPPAKKPKVSLYATNRRVALLTKAFKHLAAVFRDERENPAIGFVRTCGSVCGVGALLILLAFFLTTR